MNNVIASKNVLIQDPRDPDFVANPYALYTRLHSQGEAAYWENYGFWCFYSFETVSRALRDRRFARLPPAGYERPPAPAHLQDFTRSESSSLLALEPPEHTRIRRQVNHAFLSRQIGLMEAQIHKLAHDCIDRFEKLGRIELLQHYATPIPVSVITSLLGVPESDGARLTAWSNTMVRVYTLTQTRTEEIAANEAAKEFQTYLSDEIRKKKLSPRDDLLTHLLDQTDTDKALSIDEIISVSILLLNAGHEATVHQIGNAVYTLLTHYQGDKRGTLLTALANTSQADGIVEEVLRFAAPLHLFTRFAQCDIPINQELTIRKGNEVGLLLAAGNRCQKRFEQPDIFDPQRNNNAHLSFGAGLHYCVGAQLAKLEIRTALQVLFDRLPELELEQQPDYQDSYHFHGLQTLNVRW